MAGKPTPAIATRRNCGDTDCRQWVSEHKQCLSIPEYLTLLQEAAPGWTLPQPFYTDPDIYAFDVSTIFTRSWLMLGFETELPQVGSYLALTVGPNPVFLVRNRDGKILGFHNTCRHRGAQILADGIGRVPKVVCPYHKWTYDLDVWATAGGYPDAGRF